MVKIVAADDNDNKVDGDGTTGDGDGDVHSKKLNKNRSDMKIGMFI